MLNLCFQDVVTVFSNRMAGSECYRIPTILRLASGALLAFAEQRVDGCGDNGENNLVLRLVRSLIWFVERPFIWADDWFEAMAGAARAKSAGMFKGVLPRV